MKFLILGLPNIPFYTFSQSHSHAACDCDRPVKPNPFQGLAPAVCAMTHSHFTHLGIHHLKAGPAPFSIIKKHASSIAQACTVGTSPLTSTLVPLTLHRPSALVVVGHLKSSNVPQQSKEWFDLRKNKLTTSTFSTALGFWKASRRAELWHEKVFEQDSDAIAAAARAAMEWGVLQESAAVERYKTITGRDVGTMGFVIHAEEKFGWLGASPDGLLGCFPEEGILEVKCPYNKGKPELGLPWSAVPFYYMPQLQGQMEILDREWVELYCWTPNGSTLFHVRRHRGYWELMHGILREFWWECVVPAKEAILMGREADVNAYRPAPRHPQTGSVISWSRKLASEARLLCREIKGHLEFQSR